MRRITILWALPLLAGGLFACVSNYPVTGHDPVAAYKAQGLLSAKEQLTVGVVAFDPGSSSVPPGSPRIATPLEIREAEARYLAHGIGTALKATGHWDSVSVVPAATGAVDVTVEGRIVASDGVRLILDIAVKDAAGWTWINDTYGSSASPGVYRNDNGNDPFRAVFDAIARDVLTARRRLSDSDAKRLRAISTLRYADGLVPDSFKDYLLEDNHGRYRLNRLPPRDDPIMIRIEEVHGRNGELLELFDDHYARFSQALRAPYRRWRQRRFQEVMAMRRAQPGGTWLDAMAMTVGFGGLTGGRYLHQTTGFVMPARQQADMQMALATHLGRVEAIDAAFVEQLEPVMIEVEERTRTLGRYGADQYGLWQRLIREIHGAETGRI